MEKVATREDWRGTLQRSYCRCSVFEVMASSAVSKPACWHNSACSFRAAPHPRKAHCCRVEVRRPPPKLLMAQAPRPPSRTSMPSCWPTCAEGHTTPQQFHSRQVRTAEPFFLLPVVNFASFSGDLPPTRFPQEQLANEVEYRRVRLTSVGSPISTFPRKISH